jgi:hypothetical protein
MNAIIISPQQGANMRSEQGGFSALHPKLYKTWHSMLDRCNNHKHMQFMSYGGRGISVDPVWVSFKTFVGWALANGFDGVRTLDRIDNNGGYGPLNCRWADKKMQARNRRDNVFYEFNGDRKTLPEWAELYDLKVITLVSRVVRMGWDMERALTTRPASRNGMYEMDGEIMHITEWAKKAGIKPDALYLRMKRGKTLSEAVMMRGRKC